jgi:NAD(P)-dependent dehydrogenase (short-subunit alcohol dehydrogenase family)
MLATFEFDSPVWLCQSEFDSPFLPERAKQLMTDLKDRTALVTGATSGIGKATALALAARGARVLVVGRNERRARDVVAEIEGGGGSAAYRLVTLSDLESARDLVQWATEAGDGHVDILINNAGVALLGPSSAATEPEFDETFALNVKVPFFLVVELAPAMAERGWGSVVNISTMVASFGQAGMAMYGASRAALELLTKAWAAEYGPSGVRVNAVAPGPTRTALTEAMPEEMVNQFAALAPAGRVAGPRNSPRRSSSSRATTPASSTASPSRSTAAGSRHDASRTTAAFTGAALPAGGGMTAVRAARETTPSRSSLACTTHLMGEAYEQVRRPVRREARRPDRPGHRR